MNGAERIAKRFARLRQEKRAGLIPFLMGGDPDFETGHSCLEAVRVNGADLMEIGMPFSDPMADGPIIQAAALRALNQGANRRATLHSVLEHCAALRQKDEDMPLILMGYANPIHRYGLDRFSVDARQSGADGLIVVDMPPGESDELNEAARNAGLALIRLVTPVTPPERLDAILDQSEGFIYYVSVTGVTGTSRPDPEDIRSHFEDIRQKTDLPIAAGFGIRTPEDVKAFAEFADAVVVGSALVETVAAIAQGKAKSEDLSKQVKSLSCALLGQ